MSVFLISYDLRKPDYNYEPLYAALKKVNAKHVQDSVWGLNTISTARLFLAVHAQRQRQVICCSVQQEERIQIAKRNHQTAGFVALLSAHSTGVSTGSFGSKQSYMTARACFSSGNSARRTRGPVKVLGEYRAKGIRCKRRRQR